MYKKINWIASFPKSGNTWIRCFFEAYFTGKIDINNIKTSVADTAAYRCTTGNTEDPAKLPLEIQNLIRPMGLVRLVQKYNEDVAKGYKHPLLVKTHNAHVNVNGIEVLPPALSNAVIYIIRDPRDVIVSYAKHMGESIDQAIEHFNNNKQMLTDDRGGTLTDYVSDWSTHVMSFFNSKAHNVKIIRYEDLLTNPYGEFIKILKHFSISINETQLVNAISLCDFFRLQRQEIENGFKERSNKSDKFFTHGRSVYKDILNSEQIVKIELQHSEVMERFRYARSTSQIDMQNKTQAC